MRIVYWIILVSTVIANLWIAHDFSSWYGQSFSLLLAEASGRVVGMLILPIIAWAIMGRKRKSSLLAFCAIGGALTTSLALVGSYSRRETEQKKLELKQVYSIESCKFTVNFPDIPNVQTLYAPGIGEYKQAGFSTKDAYLRMECIPINYTQPREQSRAMLEKYAEADGYTGTNIQAVTNSSDALWEMRAYKKVDSVPVTFKFQVFYADGSLMILAVGIPSKDYPLPIEDKFFGSVRRK